MGHVHDNPLRPALLILLSPSEALRVRKALIRLKRLVNAEKQCISAGPAYRSPIHVILNVKIADPVYVVI